MYSVGYIGNKITATAAEVGEITMFRFDNVGSTSFKTSIVPNLDSTADLGEGPNPWQNIYVEDIRWTGEARPPSITAPTILGKDSNPITNVYCDDVTYDSVTQKLYYDYRGINLVAQSYTSGTTKKISFISLMDDSDSWNATDYRYDVQIYGLFEIDLSQTWVNTTSSSGNRIIEIKVNGERIAGQTLAVAEDGEYHMSLKKTQLLNIGDYVEFYAYQNSGSTVKALSNAIIHLAYRV
jgi:hypothetical protein